MEGETSLKQGTENPMQTDKEKQTIATSSIQEEVKDRIPSESKGHQDIDAPVYSDWDLIADIPTVHFSFLVNLVLPKHAVASRDPRLEDEIKKLNAKNHPQNDDAPCHYIPVGSNVEGYQIPRALSKVGNTTSKAVFYSDLDVLVAWNMRPITQLDPNAETKQKLILETNGVHPGYCRLFVNDPETVLKGVDPTTAISFGERLYFNAKKVRDDVKILLEQTVGQSMINAAKIIVDQMGPAVGVEDLTERTRKVFMENKRMDHPRQEFVAALPILWPKSANAWKTRIKGSDWLTDAVTASIIEDGCHVVPVPHRHSKCPDIEWRLSFATSEVMLAKQAVTGDQRQCYIYLKLLRQERLKGSELLSSYHFKTAFLYSCERLPIRSWNENPGGCILYVLDTLANFVKDRWLPTYFLPENNLLDHLTEDEFQRADLLLASIRTDPISPILEFTDTNIVANQSVVTPFREMIKPVLDDFPLYKIHRNKMVSSKEFIFTLTMFINTLFLDDKVEDVVHYLVDLHSFFKIYFPSDSFSKFLNCFITQWKLTTQCIKYLEFALENYSVTYPDVTHVDGNLGCLYHTLSYQHPEGASQNIKSKEKSEYYFKRYLKDSEMGTSVTINYALYLMKNVGNDKCSELLNAAIEKESEFKNKQNIFNLTTIITLEDQLRNELNILIQQRKIIAIPTLSLAFYILLKNELYRKNTKTFETVIQKFQKHCKQTNTFWNHYLYALASTAANNWKEAKTGFEMANKCMDRPFSSPIMEVVCHVETLLYADRVSDAAKYVLAQPLERFGLSRVRLIESIVFKLNNTSKAVQLTGETLDMLADDPEIKTFQGNLACVHFASAFDFESDSEECLTSLVRAETLFCTFISNFENQHFATIVDYAAFLCYQKRLEEAKNVIESGLSNEGNRMSTNNYGKTEYPTLDKQLRKEVEMHGQITGPTKAFAYYFLLQCVKHLKESSAQIKGLKTEFANFCKESKNGTAYSLLGYSELLEENWFRAEHWFCKAVEAKWDYAAAKQMVSFCRCKRAPIAEDKYEEEYVPLCIVSELRGNV